MDPLPTPQGHEDGAVTGPGRADGRDRLSMRPLAYTDVPRAVCWLSDVETMHEVLPLNVRPRPLDVIALIEHGSSTGSLMSWAFDLADGTPAGMGCWREDAPWPGVFHVEVIMSPLVPERATRLVEAYRMLRDRVFTDLAARRVTAKATGPRPDPDPVFAPLGMAGEGVLRGHAELGSTELDIHLFGIRRREWAARA